MIPMNHHHIHPEPFIIHPRSLSWFFKASWISPISSRMVEISAVMVASTRCREVMMECVASTRARISSRSTFTASMAAVKSSMSRSQARTMRRMWFTSPEDGWEGWMDGWMEIIWNVHDFPWFFGIFFSGKCGRMMRCLECVLLVIWKLGFSHTKRHVFLGTGRATVGELMLAQISWWSYVE